MPRSKKSSRNPLLWLFFCSILILGSGFLWFSKFHRLSKPLTRSNQQVVVGLSWGTLREERWQTDLKLLTAELKNLGASVITKSANTDANLQISQAENLINQGVDILIVVPEDAASAAKIVEKAHQAGIKVLSYDRLIRNSNLDYYVSFDNEKVGRLQAEGVINQLKNGNLAYIGGSPTDNNSLLLKEGTMKVLEPHIKTGQYKLALDEFTQDWKPEIAYETMKKYLASGKKIDGVIAANDGTAFGVIKALQEKNLAGKVPVSGQDAELGACQRIVQGTQTLTIYKPIPLLAKQAAIMAVQIAENKNADTNAEINNGQIDVPSFLLEPISVNKQNLDQTIIKDNFHPAEQIYKP